MTIGRNQSNWSRLWSTVLGGLLFVSWAFAQEAESSASDTENTAQRVVALGSQEPAADEFLSEVDLKNPLTSFEETIDHFNGTVQINMVDVSLPGAGGLDLVIQRYYSSEIWNRTDNGGGAVYHSAAIDLGDRMGGNGWAAPHGKGHQPVWAGGARTRSRSTTRLL